MYSETSQRVNNDSAVIEIMSLHPQEMELLKAIRHRWKYGEITILARNGLPYRMVRTQEFIDLSKPNMV